VQLLERLRRRKGEAWDWYKVVKAALALDDLWRYPAFILWNGGCGLHLALPRGAERLEGWVLEKRGEPEPLPAVPLARGELEARLARAEPLLGAALLSPVPYAEAVKEYASFVVRYEAAPEELEGEREWWREAEACGFRIYRGFALRFLGSEEGVGGRAAKLEEHAEGDEGAREAAGAAERLLRSRAERLKRGPLLLTQRQLERLLHALSVAYREPVDPVVAELGLGSEVFLARDFSIALRPRANNNVLVVGEPRTRGALVGFLLAELSKRKYPPSILVLDWAGNYAFLEKHGFLVLEALDPVCNPLALGPAEALEVLEKAAYQSEEGRLLQNPAVAVQAMEALHGALGGGRGGTLVDAARILRERAQRASAEWERRAAEEALRALRPFIHPAFCARGWALPEGRVVVDLGGLPDERVRKAVALTMLRTILVSAGRWRGLVVVDEIQNYLVPTPAGLDLPIIADIARFGIAVWGVGRHYHLVPSGLHGARAVAVFRQTDPDALRAVELSMGREAAEAVHSLPDWQFYLFAVCSVPAVRVPPPGAEGVAREMAEWKGERAQLDFAQFATRFGIDHVDLVELYVKCLPHALAILRFALKQASPEGVEEVRKLDLTTDELHALAQLYATRYGLPSRGRLGA
jgi:hypothetical protein